MPTPIVIPDGNAKLLQAPQMSASGAPFSTGTATQGGDSSHPMDPVWYRTLQQWAQQFNAISQGVKVSQLPTPSNANLGNRAFVVDSTQTTTAGIGAAVVGGGTNKVPVHSDGSAWRIG
jgi:hypothetical protein